MSITYPTCEDPMNTEAANRHPVERSEESTTDVFELDPLTDPRWSTFTDLHPDASVFHRVEWLKALKDCYNYEPRVVSLTPPGSPLRSGLVFCYVRSAITGNRLVSLPFSDHCEPLVSRPQEFSLLLQKLIARVDRTGLKYLEVRPLTVKPGLGGFLAASNTYFLHRLDLQGSEDALFRSFHRNSVQRRILRAEREKLSYQEGRSEAILEYFYELLTITRRRQGLPPQPRKWFRSLITHLGDNMKIRVALKGDNPVASILTLSDRTTMVYKYGCSAPRFNNLGGTALLFWRTIQEAQARGMKAFDLGRSDIDNQGLVTFKQHWGAKQTSVTYWRYPVGASALRPENSIRHVKRLISMAPDWSLVMLGNLLYRHIG